MTELEILAADLAALGHGVHMVTPLGRRTFPLPTKPPSSAAMHTWNAAAPSSSICMAARALP